MHSGAGHSFFRQAASKRSAQEGERKLQEAIAAGNKKDYRAAVAILEEIISEYEGPPEAFLYLGRALHSLQNYSRALAAFNDYITIKPRSAEGYFFAGRSCLVLGFSSRAVHYLEQALMRNKKNSETMALLGTALLKARHSQAGLEMLQKAVETAPENKRIYRAYLNALFIRAVRVCRNDNYELGIQMLRFVLENGRDGPLIRLELGRTSRQMGLLEEAVEHYSRALEFSPSDPMIRWYRASIYMELDRKTDALEDLSIIRSQGIQLPDLPWNSMLVDRFMITSFLEEGQWRRAADACRNWIKTRGSDPAIHAMYGEAQRNLKNYPAAENHLFRALEQDGKNLRLWYAVMLVAWEGRNMKTLKKALYTAKKLGAEKEILSRFSLLYESETAKDLPRIIALLQKAIHTMGPEPELMYALGIGYLKTGLLAEAVSWFSKTLILQPRHEESYLGLIAAQEALFNDGEKGAAKNLTLSYRNYLNRWPDNRSIRRDEALFLIKTCEYETASKKLEALLAWDPANPGLRRVLAYAYRKQGNYRSAAVYLRALLKEKPRDIRLLLEYSGCIERAGAIQYAKAILKKAHAYFTKSSEIPTALGLLAYREGNLEQTFEYLLDAAGRNHADPRPFRWMYLIAKEKGDIQGARRYEQEYQRVLNTAASPRRKK
ncbi:MAG: tetratricopeptide repeat protein [Spirochaetaceae bacterium]|jgi:tetratricopeptide (TPR) repeat protein|nr:tetratricopeptide repeat protein [Spirochaetaceae bacterium]